MYMLLAEYWSISEELVIAAKELWEDGHLGLSPACLQLGAGAEEWQCIRVRSWDTEA